MQLKVLAFGHGALRRCFYPGMLASALQQQFHANSDFIDFKHWI
jgi:hypothetical protein